MYALFVSLNFLNFLNTFIYFLIQVLNILQWIDKKSEYTHSLIFSSEYKVFKTVGFKMPFCTPLNCIEVLLAATGLKDNPNMQELTTGLLDLVYLQVRIFRYTFPI